jgi:linoleoyl-CoA desaturase
VNAKKLLWFKMVFYFLIHLSAYLALFLFPLGKPGLLVDYIFIGLSGILLAFNVSHDACHQTFSRNKKLNNWLYHLSFDIQGLNAYLWKIRHTGSHHLFPNVDGCDADIDDNPFIRLSPHHPFRRYQRYQHLYSFFVYCFYTLHWFLFKDFLYLFKKKIANLQQKKHPVKQYFLFFFWKLIYLSFTFLLPLCAGYPFGNILLAFFVMHFISALFFIHVLIITHLCMETQFPKTDENGCLPGDYYTHQLTTSLDYSPTNKIYNWFLGGFNSHAAHHLYPKLPHTAYPVISRFIERRAKQFNVPYNKLSLWAAIRSHYKYLRVMGRPICRFKSSNHRDFNCKDCRSASVHVTAMKQISVLVVALLISLAASSQKKYVSLAVFNTQAAMPFGKFFGMFTDQFHPGIEAGYGINVSVKEKHDWFTEFKIACFYHRFVQTGIPLYVSFGYRYKIAGRFSAETSLGIGYFHSVPATAKLKLNQDGVYVNNKGIGRMQAMATFGLGLGYTINPSAKKPVTAFTIYQQRIQMPFVKSYVPLLPYNSFMIGIKKSIK